MRSLRILQLCPFFHPVIGGLEEVVLRLSTHMIARGHAVVVFTSNLSRTGRVNGRVDEVQGVPVRRFPAWVRLGPFASLWPGFCRDLGAGRFDVIHAHSYRHPHCDLASLGPIRGGAKLILDPHWAAYPRGPAQTIVANAYDAVFGRRVFRASDLVLAATPLEIPWSRAMGATSVKVLPHGIPARYLGRGDGAGFRKRRGIEGFVVASIGRIDESKGFQWVVRALPRVPGVRYVIAGPPGPFSSELARLISSQGVDDRVSLLGEISEEEKLRLLDACDVFVQPSRFEAFGVSALEALARGAPCVGARAGGLAWVLGDCGLLFEPGHIEGIRQCLVRLRDDARLRETLSAAGRAKAAALTWDRVAAAYEGMLLDLVAS